MANTPVSSNEHLIIVGKLEHLATVTELILCGALRVLLGCQPKVARAIFYTLDSFPGKRNLLQRVVAEVGDDRDKTLVDAMIAAAERASNQRRQVAHAVVFFKEQDLGSSFKIFSPKSGDEKQVSKEWHQHLYDHSSEAQKAGLEAYAELCQKRGVPLLIDL